MPKLLRTEQVPGQDREIRYFDDGTSAGSTSIIVGVAINSTSLYILQDLSKS